LNQYFFLNSIRTFPVKNVVVGMKYVHTVVFMIKY